LVLFCDIIISKPVSFKHESFWARQADLLNKLINEKSINLLLIKFIPIIFFFWSTGSTNLFAMTTNSNKENLCDKLAALEADPLRKKSPVALSDINPKLVIFHCSNMLDIDPKNSDRYLFQRARGHLKAENFDAFIADMKASYQLGYPAAAFGLGVAYFLGEAVEQNPYSAEILLKEAFEKKVYWAAKALSQLYGNARLPLYNQKKSKYWMQNFHNVSKNLSNEY